jgi:hypothetical protein
MKQKLFQDISLLNIVIFHILFHFALEDFKGMNTGEQDSGSAFPSWGSRSQGWNKNVT